MQTSTFFPGKKKYLLVFLLLLTSNLLLAQKTEKNNNEFYNWSVNVNGGYSQFWGYLNTRRIDLMLKHEPTWAFGLTLTRQFSPVFGLRGDLIVGSLKVNKTYLNVEGTYSNSLFSSNFIEGDITAKLSISDLLVGYKQKRYVNIYGLAGLGFSNLEGTVTTYSPNPTVNQFGYGSGSGINGYELDGVATLGLGVAFRINKSLNLTIENSLKIIDANKLKERKGIIHFDTYSYSSVGLSYNFGLKKSTAIPVKKEDLSQTKPAEVKKETPVVPIKTEPEVKKEVAIPPVKTEPKITPPEPAKQEVKPVEKIVMFTGYKVQILATSSPASFDNIMLKYNLKEQIREDHTDKWYRYSVGEFKSFREALAYKRILYTRNKIKDGFVVKITNGKRIGPVWK